MPSWNPGGLKEKCPTKMNMKGDNRFFTLIKSWLVYGEGLG